MLLREHSGKSREAVCNNDVQHDTTAVVGDIERKGTEMQSIVWGKRGCDTVQKRWDAEETSYQRPAEMHSDFLQHGT